ncbi:hypothetical protein N7462_003849 [Penicillium macrosclerotiorum]|uniref:uncharacterized protein n=1 Tax=Penicillium macrosclerotiorum TaxID=303699 RepID=UPI0025485C91|nr:uncharacterized protein N7462_003849 [Penicillium macrosclerotiorum]KAJ5689457.1 hypothetical protein N7462_003849 [Penicillium macrosclerotiorum]
MHGLPITTLIHLLVAYLFENAVWERRKIASKVKKVGIAGRSSPRFVLRLARFRLPKRTDTDHRRGPESLRHWKVKNRAVPLEECEAGIYFAESSGNASNKSGSGGNEEHQQPTERWTPSAVHTYRSAARVWTGSKARV